MRERAEKPVSFENEIKPLFRQFDIDSMLEARGFDLSKYADVSARADKILRRLKGGTMPCDGAWPPEKIGLFEDWILTGKLP